MVTIATIFLYNKKFCTATQSESNGQNAKLAYYATPFEIIVIYGASNYVYV